MTTRPSALGRVTELSRAGTWFCLDLCECCRRWMLHTHVRREAVAYRGGGGTYSVLTVACDRCGTAKLWG